MNMSLTIAGEEEGRCGVIHGCIPHGGACPPGGGATASVMASIPVHILSLTCSIDHMYYWLCIRFWIKSSRYLNMFSIAGSLPWREDRVDEEVEELCHWA
jgi:hypothetical protein